MKHHDTEMGRQVSLRFVNDSFLYGHVRSDGTKNKEKVHKGNKSNTQWIMDFHSYLTAGEKLYQPTTYISKTS